MPAREPKSTQITSIQIVGRNGTRKGRLEMTSGNVEYFRSNGKDVALKLTYQQLISLLERELEYRSVDIDGPMPKGLGKGEDCNFLALSKEHVDDELFPIAQGRFSLANLDPRRVDDGRYHLDAGLADGRQSEKKWWHIQISVPFALTIVGLYIDKWLIGTRKSKSRDKSIVVTKSKMRETLIRLLKKLDD